MSPEMQAVSTWERWSEFLWRQRWDAEVAEVEARFEVTT